MEKPIEQAQPIYTTPSSAFIKENINVLRMIIKEHDQQAKAKMTPRKLVYDGSREENSNSSRIRGSLKRLSNESSSKSRTRNITRTSGKSQRRLSRSKASSQLRRSERLENQSKSKAKLRGERASFGGKRPEQRVVSLNTKGEGGLEDRWEDLNMPYARN
nr:hypothetical protein [Tanacetum cinerariifolium]